MAAIGSDDDSTATIWAPPRRVERLEDCAFYHTMEIPGFGVVDGDWDLRGREAEYLGGIELAGKRVLELGTASGHLCFTMERLGAEVSAYDLSHEHDWDLVPFAGLDLAAVAARRRAAMRRINDGWWLAHRAFGSRARVAYGAIYALPPAIGTYDVATFGSILLHLRDPFLALQRVAPQVREAMVVTDITPGGSSQEMLRQSRLIAFAPVAANRAPVDTWWHLPPGLVAEFLRILGFEEIAISFHRQRWRGRETELFTVVGRRSTAFRSP